MRLLRSFAFLLHLPNPNIGAQSCLTLGGLEAAESMLSLGTVRVLRVFSVISLTLWALIQEVRPRVYHGLVLLIIFCRDQLLDANDLIFQDRGGAQVPYSCSVDDYLPFSQRLVERSLRHVGLRAASREIGAGERQGPPLSAAHVYR